MTRRRVPGLALALAALLVFPPASVGEALGSTGAPVAAPAVTAGPAAPGQGGSTEVGPGLESSSDGRPQRAGGGAPPPGEPPIDVTSAHVPDVILVGFRSGTAASVMSTAQRASGAVGATTLSPLAGNTKRLKLKPGANMKDVIATLRRDPNVRFAEPDYLVSRDAIPDDPLVTDGTLWGMLSGSGAPANAYGSGARAAWAAGFTGSRQVVVGVVDEGIQFDHPDLAPNIWTNPGEIAGNGIDDDANGYIDDVHGWDFKNDDATVYDSPNTDSHGTHVSGTIGGAGGNGVGVAGVNWAVTMISAKFLEGSGDTSDAVRALDYLTDLKLHHGVNIVATNNSWGGGDESQALRDAINRGGDAGILFVAAAGNSATDNDTTPFFPASSDCTTRFDTGQPRGWDCIVSVAAIDAAGGLASFSNRGATTVDLGAPGVDITSTVPPSTYASYNGTSMATPHVTGAIALLASCTSGLNASTLRSDLLSSAAATASLAGKTVTGSRLDIGALTGMCDTSGPPTALLISPAGWITGSTFVVKAWFNRAVSGLTASDVTADPVSAGWTVDTVTGSGMGPYAITLSAGGTADGVVTVTLTANSVTDGSQTGPPTATSAPAVHIDRTAPIVTTPVVTPASVPVSAAARVTASASDSTIISAASMRIDGGAWQGMGPVDGGFDGSPENLAALVGGTVVQVSAGTDSTCALLSDGHVRCWGDDYFGQLGTGTTASYSNVPIEIAGLSGVVSISSGYHHTCALSAGGTIRCWGDNLYGQLGNGTFSSLPTRTPVTVSGITNAVAVSAGLFFSCALLADGTVRCWGFNHGELGDGSVADRWTPVEVAGISSAVAIGAGSNSACALLANGTVQCWGNGADGRLGSGSLEGHRTPVSVVGITTATAIAVSVGGHHACALLAGGGIRCWGLDYYGQLGDGGGPSASSPVVVGGIATAVAITTGYAFSCATLADTTVRCWGDNVSGQLGNGTTDGSGSPVVATGVNTVTAISANGNHVCILDTAAAVRCWGNNFLGNLGDGTTIDRTTSVGTTGLGGPLSPGGHAVCVRATDGPGNTSAGTVCAAFTVTADNTAPTGAFGAPTTPTNAAIVRYALGFGEPVGGLTAADLQLSGTATGCSIGPVTGSGATYLVTLNGCGPGTVGLRLLPATVTDPAGNPGPAAQIVASTVTIDRTSPTIGPPLLKPSSATANSAVAVSATAADPSVAASADVRTDAGGWLPMSPADGSFNGPSESVSSVVNLGSSATAVAAGGGFTCALIGDGTVRCWGENSLHQLGDGTTTNRTTPVQVVGVTGATAIAAGSDHACAIVAGGGIRCWGSNENGQLGDGSGSGLGYALDAVAVTGVSGAFAIAAGGKHTCAILVGGAARCWGNNTYGALGDGTTSNRSTPVAVTSLGAVSAIAAGLWHTCAVLVSGTAKCWGAGFLGDGVSPAIRQSSATPVAVVGVAGATRIGAGYATSCALVSGGAVRCWGASDFGQSGDGTTDYSLTSSTSVTGVSGAVAISVGGRGACAVLSDGGTRCWGMNVDGQLGDGSTTNRLTPVAVARVTSATSVSTGPINIDTGLSAFHSCVVVSDGTVDCWGAGGAGELGDGATADRLLAAPVAGIAPALTVGPHQVCVRASDRAGNASDETACSTLTITIDTTPPGVALTSPATPTKAASLTYGVTFDEPVSGLAAADFSVTGAAGCSVATPTAASTTVYSVAVNGCGDGTVVLHLAPGSVVDAAANAGPSTEATASPVTIDRTAATAVLTAPATPTAGSILTYQLTFSEPVSGLTAADFGRSGTAVGCVVGTPSGAGTTYSIAVTGCGTGTVILSLHAAGVTDAATNAAPSAAVAASAVTVDQSAPSVTAPSVAARVSAVTVGAAVPYRLTWTGADSGSGIARYEVAQSVNGGSYVSLTTVATSPVANLGMVSGRSYRFRVRAVDRVGHVSAWATGPTIVASLVQQTSASIHYGGAWSTGTSAVFSGGTTRFARSSGPSASYTFTGRSIALVSTLATVRGRVRVYIDGAYVTRLDLFGSPTTYHDVVYARTWTTSSRHTIRIVVEGTSGRPRIDLDAFAVLR